jgi:uncharacterized protein YbcI
MEKRQGRYNEKVDDNEMISYAIETVSNNDHTYMLQHSRNSLVKRSDKLHTCIIYQDIGKQVKDIIV